MIVMQNIHYFEHIVVKDSKHIPVLETISKRSSTVQFSSTWHVLWMPLKHLYSWIWCTCAD